MRSGYITIKPQRPDVLENQFRRRNGRLKTVTEPVFAGPSAEQRILNEIRVSHKSGYAFGRPGKY
jgi:hypothetical protein